MMAPVPARAQPEAEPERPDVRAMEEPVGEAEAAPAEAPATDAQAPADDPAAQAEAAPEDDAPGSEPEVVEGGAVEVPEAAPAETAPADALDTDAAPADALDTEALAGLSLEELLTLEVTTVGRRAQRVSDAPGVVSVITREEIDAYGANSLRDVLLRAAHFYPIPNFITGGAALGVRGDTPFAGNHILYLIDGRPIRSGLNGSGHEIVLNTFPVSRIERIEVVRGPGSVLYGSTAYTGVVNIITRKQSDGVSADVRLAGGSFQTGVLDGEVEYGRGDLHLAASVYGTHTRGFLQSGYDSDGIDGSGRLSGDRLGGTLSLEFRGLTVNVFAGATREASWIVLPVWPRPDFTTHYVWADVGYGRDFFGDKLRIEGHVTANHLDGNGTVTAPDIPGLPETVPGALKSNSLLGELTVHYQPLESLRFIAGATVENIQGHEDARPDGFLGQVVTLGEVGPWNQVWWSGYLQGEYRPIEQLTLVAGVQLNKPEGVDIDFAPRAGLIYRIREGLGMKLLWGRAFRNAYPFERDIEATMTVARNPRLEPEHIQTSDFEIFYSRPRFSMSAVGFYSRYDFIDLGTNDDGEPAFVNHQQDDPRQSVGAELEIRAEPVDHFHVYGSFTYNHILAGGTSARDLAPRVSGQLGARYAHPRGVGVAAFYTLHGQPALTHVSGGSTTPGGTPTMSPALGGVGNFLSLHATVDLTKLLQRATGPGVELGVYATNIASSQQTNDFSFIELGLWRPASIYGEVRVRY
jgi:outer membrane receptor protein involved in Fe transport